MLKTNPKIIDKNIYKNITSFITKNKVVLFMKGTPESPMCGFSSTVVNILNILQTKFIGVNVLDNEVLRQSIKDFSDWPTIPQLYINKKFIGGCDIVQEMFNSGELKRYLLLQN